MRIFVGLLVLLALFASAAAWQGRLTHDLRKRHDQQVGVPENSAVAKAVGQTLQAGWNTLVVGRPSGAEPFFKGAQQAPAPVTRRPARAARPAAQMDGADGSEVPERQEVAPLPRFEPDFEILVRPGDVLSKICQGHYRTRPDGMALHKIVEAVGRYNGLSSANALRADAVLRLPDVNRLTGSDPSAR